MRDEAGRGEGVFVVTQRVTIHPFAKVAFWAAIVNFMVNLVILLTLAVSPRFFGALSLDNIFVTGILSIAVFGPGIHTLIKYWFPGNTVFERKRKPQSGDLLRVVIAFVLETFNILVAIGLFLLTFYAMGR
ncbi:MAG: hypothetical protein ACYTHM_01160 [Planctomycetota bacterium]|jgi:hypothetical protein